MTSRDSSQDEGRGALRAGITTGQLRLDAPTLSHIFQCQITNWTDPAIAQLNPNLM